MGLKINRGTSDPISLLEGEPYFNTSSKKLFVGDGSNIEEINPTMIAASRIADGSVSDTEFKYLDGVTSNIQSQFGTKMNKFVFGTGTSLTIDGSAGNFFVETITANASFSLSNLVVGMLYEIIVKNTSGSAAVDVTIPNTADFRELDTVSISDGKAREFSIVYDGTNRYWQISQEINYA